jgi:bifunctional UDP-N-acetylglucosamine pyrophosphorylase/glucosamine-1-phosphate N-acetyltransferase
MYNMKMDLSIVILAAGRGRRMRSSIPKVLHEVLGRPMLQYSIDAVKALKPEKLVVVVGNGSEAVRERIDDNDIAFVLQKSLLGTGNALSVAIKSPKVSGKDTILVLNGDCPLITAATLKTLLKKHRRDGNILSFLSFIDDSLSGYGRVMRNDNDNVIGIVEDKHATSKEKNIFRELNGGVYIMEPEALDWLVRIRKNSSSGEFYLTDIVNIISKKTGKVGAYQCAPEEIRGINSREELHEITMLLNRKNISKLMKKGVTFIKPDSSFVHSSVSVGKDTVIYPNTFIEGRTEIGKNCIIFPGTRIYQSIISDGVTVKDNTLIEESRIRSGSVIGPFAHLRPGSIIGRNVKIGNFVEVKKTRVGDGSKASHLTYLGDAEIGREVNIGAGTITCNYDGVDKCKTVIESGAFIGSNSQLVAPVKIGKRAQQGKTDKPEKMGNKKTVRSEEKKLTAVPSSPLQGISLEGISH